RPYGGRFVPCIPLLLGRPPEQPPGDRGRRRHALRKLERSDRGTRVAAARRRAEGEATGPVDGAEDRVRGGDPATGRGRLGCGAGARPLGALTCSFVDNRTRMRRTVLLVVAVALAGCGSSHHRQAASPTKLRAGPTQHFRS